MKTAILKIDRADEKRCRDAAGYGHLKSFIFEIVGIDRDEGNNIFYKCRVLSHNNFFIRQYRYKKCFDLVSAGNEDFVCVSKIGYLKNELVGSEYIFNSEFLTILQ